MSVPNNRNKLLQRQIPTILGLVILVVALGAGLFFFSDGLGVFAPRATPQTTPKNIRVSNVTDTGFTISFITDETTPGFIKYGTEPTSLRSQASDDRDQLSGSVGSYSLHHITVRGLDSNTNYYYVLGTGSQSEFDNQGAPFELKTAQRGGTPTAAKTIYGNVLNTSGGPAEGSIVYVSSDNMGDMSSLVKSSGSWAVPLSNARTTDGSGYAQVTDATILAILAQGALASEASQLTTSVANSQPVETITLGQNGNTAVAPPQVVFPSPSLTPVISPLDASPSPSATTSAMGGLDTLATPLSTGSGTLPGTAVATPSATVVDLTKTTIPVITTSQPTIIGEAAPNVVVNIKVNSDTQIDQQITADENGDFELDIALLEAELEPGQHSVEYSYVDPLTGNTVTKSKNFSVQPSVQLAQASTGRTSTQTDNQIAQAQPFGSGNPVPIGGTSTNSAVTASPNPSPSPTASASASPISTTSGRTSQPSTASGIPTSGSVGVTFALLLGGGFFLITGLWSYWMSRQLRGETST